MASNSNFEGVLEELTAKLRVKLQRETTQVCKRLAERWIAEQLFQYRAKTMEHFTWLK